MQYSNFQMCMDESIFEIHFEFDEVGAKKLLLLQKRGFNFAKKEYLQPSLYYLCSIYTIFGENMNGGSKNKLSGSLLIADSVTISTLYVVVRLHKGQCKTSSIVKKLTLQFAVKKVDPRCDSIGGRNQHSILLFLAFT